MNVHIREVMGIGIDIIEIVEMKMLNWFRHLKQLAEGLDIPGEKSEDTMSARGLVQEG